MIGGKDDVLGILLGCRGPVSAKEITTLVQNRCYAEEHHGFFNLLWGVATRTPDEDLPAFPPLRRIKRSLRALERAGYAMSVVKQSSADWRWCDHYSATKEGKAHYSRRNEHVRPLRA